MHKTVPMDSSIETGVLNLAEVQAQNAILTTLNEQRAQQLGVVNNLEDAGESKDGTRAGPEFAEAEDVLDQLDEQIGGVLETIVNLTAGGEPYLSAAVIEANQIIDMLASML